MKFSTIFAAAIGVMIMSAPQMASAENGRYDFEFNAPAFSFGFNTPKSKGSSTDLAPLDDDFSEKPRVDVPRTYSDRREPQYIEPGRREFQDDGDQHSLKDGNRDEDYAHREKLDEPAYSTNRVAFGCISDRNVSRNLRAGGWHNFRSYHTTRNRVKVTADNPVGLPFRLTVNRCTGAILFARLL